MAIFEDAGHYYANDVMQRNFIVLSMNSRLVYDTEDVEDVKLIKKTTDEFYAIANEDIDKDGRCFYDEAAVFLNYYGKLEWDF